MISIQNWGLCFVVTVGVSQSHVQTCFSLDHTTFYLSYMTEYFGSDRTFEVRNFWKSYN